MRARLLTLIALAFALLAGACGRRDDPASQERELERRLLAPCCWRQTLADHASPSAEALRREIRTRIAAGEPTASIEAELVRRYGPEIRALPEGGDPTWIIAAIAVGASALALVALGWFVRRRRVSVAAAPIGNLAWTEYDDRLDDELRDVD